MQRPVLFSFFILCLSCSNREKVRAFYPIDSLLNAQVHYLSGKKATLKKITTLGDKQEEISLTPKDSTAWHNELEIFAVLEDINKPMNIGYYKTEDFSDSKSNLNVRSFTTDENLPISYLRIYYYQSLGKLRKVEARFNETNPLYNSARDLSMEFQQMQDTVVLTSYDIIGGQKIFLDDSVQYNIKGSLTVLK